MQSESPPTAAPTHLAPQHLRLFALIVDYLLIAVVLKLLHQVLLGEQWDLRAGFGSTAASDALWIGGMAVFLLGRDALRGRSPGRWLTGIAVADAKNPAKAPGPLRSVLRNLLLALFPLEGVLVFTDPYCRRLGDRLAGTVVVVPAAVAPPGRRLLVLAILFLASILAAFLITPWNLRRSAAFQTARSEAEARPELERIVGGSMRTGYSPQLALSMEEGEGRASVLLTVEGNKGEAKVEVNLSLEQAPRRWRVVSFRILGEDRQKNTER